MSSLISEYMEQLCHEKDANTQSCDNRSSSVQVLNAPVPTELFDELQTLATVYNGDAHCIAGNLLSIALTEAFKSLPDDERAHLLNVRQAAEREAARKHMEDAKYDPGCT